jgi:hypothetical protein
MSIVTLSPKYQIVIPKKLRGFLKGMDTTIERTQDADFKGLENVRYVKKV